MVRNILSRVKEALHRVKTADPRAVIAARDLNSLRYEKTIVMALLVQLVIAGMSSFLVLGLVSVYNTNTDVSSIGVTGNASDAFVEQMTGEREMNPVEYDSSETLVRGVSNGAVDAGLVAQHGENGTVRVSVLVPDRELRTTIVITQIKEVLERVEHEQRDQVVDKTNYRLLDYPENDTSNPYYTFTYTVLLPLLIFLPIFISGSIMVDSITEEIGRQTIELLQASPASLARIVDAKIAVASFLAPAQAGLWLLLLSINGITISHPLGLLAYTLGVAATFVAVGTAISIKFPERQNAQLIYSSVLIAGFALLSILPQSPANIVARLAAGSATPLTALHVSGMVAMALTTYLVIRSRLSAS